MLGVGIFSSVKVSHILVKEVDLVLLKEFLKSNYGRLKIVNGLNPDEALTILMKRNSQILVADLHTVSDFINTSVEECYKLVRKFQ